MLSLPVRVSPTIKSPVELDIARTPVDAFHVLTIAVTLLAEPVIVSVSIKLPVPPVSAAPTVIDGTSIYLAPAFVR